MPTLDWIGKDKVINHYKDVPYKVLERKYSFDESGMHKEDIHSNNMIIRGDNLEALKSLLPQYEGKIKCIYIDPPYNTGNEGWIYNDNVNDPKIKKWLGEVVGKEGEDLSRHDKWLCMMYPRLVLLQKLLADEASSMEIPQFMIETGRSLFSEHVQQPLSKENLYAGFSLLDKDTVIDFDSVDFEIARIDIDDSDAMPKAWKLQGFDNQNVKKWFDEQPSDRKIRLCKDMIIKKLSKNNAVNDKDLDIYVDRIIQNLTEDQLTDMEQTPGIYALKINKKVNFLLNEYAKKMFYEWVEQDKISCLPSYKLPREISPTNTIASIPKSLYSKEENFDTEYERKVVMELSSSNNIKWWHRNMARKGFAINGAVNAYPDLMVRTESGKLLLIETKGDQLENSESREKAETGAKWAEMAGRMYKYYMVFETKDPGYNGAYSYEEFMRIVKEL